MLNILLCGVGGQGTVLGAKLLAHAASQNGWQVRSAETIGMAQRGGSVVSHIHIANAGEAVSSPLVPHGSANLIVAFEPAEAARALPYLSKCGTLACATRAVQPVTAALAGGSYNSAEVVASIKSSLNNSAATFIPFDSEKVLAQLGTSKVLNVCMLAAALKTGCIPITIQNLETAIYACVKPKFVDLNLKAVSLLSNS